MTEGQEFTLKALARQVMAQLELRRAVAERQQALNEKQLLIQEAHHRVKNSLQMVQSLLSLQARMTKHPEAAEQLRQSASRVNTFGTMHEHLYQVGAALHLNLAAYLRNLLLNQKAGLASTLHGRDITFEADDVSWLTSDAPAVGLVLMELVTNALKYGAGKISVALHRAGNDVTLSVEDEGRSLPDDYEPTQGQGLGMRIITGLLNGRRGRLEIDRTRGHTCFVAILRAPPAQIALPVP